MYLVEMNVGRLVETTLRTPVSPAEATECFAHVRKLLGSSPRQIVFCVDLRGTTILPDGPAETFIQMMKSDNPKVERSGFLLREGAATFGLQLGRILREAGSPVRKAFADAELMAAWLGEVLDPKERARVRQFLARPIP